MEQFNWEQSTDAEDFNCHWNRYHLRLENMDYRLWWWRVYFEGDCISPFEKEMCTSKNRAMGMAEGCTIGHWYAKLPNWKCYLCQIENVETEDDICENCKK